MKQCIYCGKEKPKKEMKLQTFVFQQEEKVEIKEWICKDEKCLSHGMD